MEYEIYWKGQKRKIIEGEWCAGKWMPGPLYFYVNFWHILLNKNRFTKVKQLGKPFLRDIEWDKAYVYTEAKGFSGFKDDKRYTCHRLVRTIQEECVPGHKNFETEDYTKHFLYQDLPPDAFTEKGVFKEYVEARDYLRKNHLVDLGKPLYQNEAKNVVDIECRGSGKSYWASGGMIGHNFLTDGATDYDEYLKAIQDGAPMASETLVGAINTAFSADLLSKFSLGIESLEGGIKVGNRYHPSPLSKKTKGTLAPGKNPMYAAYDVKEGGSWKEVGSRSKVHHRSFKDNPTAGNGTRPGLVILEEVGFMGNLRDALGPLEMCTANGAVQFGCTYMFGTGGDMEGGSTEAVMEVFFDPEAWDCLAFPDYYEGDGSKSIGFFVPYSLGLNQFKDDEGVTDMDSAEKFVKGVRDRKRAAKSKKPLNDEMQNNPMIPSEAFLVTSGNIFPIMDLREQLGFVESSVSTFVKGDKGVLTLDDGEMQGVRWIPDLNNELTPATYPVKKGEDMEGCIQIWEHPPTGAVPWGMYIAATDPYDQDKADQSASLGSTFIYKIGDFRDGGTREMIVAEYTGRPETAKEHHETVRRLCMYYNASNLYENEKNSLKFHFDACNSLHLLASAPDVLKANQSTGVNRGYGQHMPIKVKQEIEILARDWLIESRGDGLTNVNYIYSPGLLKELIMYNDTGNFDRVIAFMLIIVNRMQHHRVTVQQPREEAIRDNWFNKKLYV